MPMSNSGCRNTAEITMPIDDILEASLVPMRLRGVSHPPETWADPDPSWAEANPDKLLAFLFVSPRPCAALDQLLTPGCQ
jgi:hypothetical protein